MVSGAPTIMCKWRNVVNFSAWNAKKKKKKQTLCMANLSFGLTYSSKMDLASQCQGPFTWTPFTLLRLQSCATLPQFQGMPL